MKSHQGVQIEFHRLAKDNPNIDKMFPVFLSQVYNLKAKFDSA